MHCYKNKKIRAKNLKNELKIINYIFPNRLYTHKTAIISCHVSNYTIVNTHAVIAVALFGTVYNHIQL